MWKIRRTENQEQIEVIRWCRLAKAKYPELDLLYHVPNERKCTPGQGYFLRNMGVKRGVPDICLPVARGGYHGLYIELKSETGRATAEQKKYIAALTEQGYAAYVCRGAMQAIQTIRGYLQGDE